MYSNIFKTLSTKFSNSFLILKNILHIIISTIFTILFRIPKMLFKRVSNTLISCNNFAALLRKYSFLYWGITIAKHSTPAREKSSSSPSPSSSLKSFVSFDLEAPIKSIKCNFRSTNVRHEAKTAPSAVPCLCSCCCASKVHLHQLH